MSTLTKPPYLDRDYRPIEGNGSYQPIYQHPAGRTFIMPTMCGFTPCEFEQHHGLLFDMLPSSCFPQTQYTSDCSESGNDFYPAAATNDGDYLCMPIEHGLEMEQRPYELREQPALSQETLEPRMMFRHELPVQFDESPSCFSCDPTTNVYQPEAFSFETANASYAPVTSQEQYFSYESHYSPVNSEAFLSTPRSIYGDEEEEEAIMDKPYARLIYEALMQAPGHSMMLRDIYDWFASHTNKPRESGSNGWQNSIRHNLSMNQAFENDKSDASTRGHPRKANSIWILTEHAVKHGVQSTTRYRKSGNAKKGSSHRTPATERQKSGSKGGKAARRAALLRRQEESSRSKSPSDLISVRDKSTSRWPDPSTSPSDQISTPRYCPATPVDERHNPSSYEASDVPYLTRQPSYLKKEQNLPEDVQALQYVSDSLSHELSRVQYSDDPLSIMFT